MFERKVAHIHEFSFAPLVVVGFLSIFSFHLEVFWCPGLSREAGGKKWEEKKKETNDGLGVHGLTVINSVVLWKLALCMP